MTPPVAKLVTLDGHHPIGATKQLTPSRMLRVSIWGLFLSWDLLVGFLWLVLTVRHNAGIVLHSVIGCFLIIVAYTAAKAGDELFKETAK